MSEERKSTEPTSPAPDPTQAGAAPRAGEVVTGGGFAQRRSRWQSSFAALKYVTALANDNEIKIRDTDRATSIALLIVSILTVLSLIVRPFAPYSINLLAVVDLLAGASLSFYLANRFGILTTLPPRQALLIWQLVLGSIFIGMFVAINIGVAAAFVFASMTAIPSR